METFKAYLLIVGFVGVLGFGGYWAATSMNDPVRVSETEDIKVIAQTPIETVEETEVIEETATEETVGETNTTTQTGGENDNADLLARLQKLITDNIVMKEGSRGTRVGTVQEFLNLYNNTTGGIDNEYGPGTKAKVLAFQKAQGLSADGQAGPGTYQKMIDWLNSN